MDSYVKLFDVADERGESPAKVARILVRQGCDLYLHFGESRESRAGVSFYPEHPTERMEHNIGAGEHPLTKDSQEALIASLGRVGETSTKGLMILDYWEPETKSLEFIIELMEQDDTVCVVFDSEDLKFLPPLPAYQDGAVTGSPNTPEDIFFENPGKNKSRTKNGNRAKHTLIIWDALQDCDEKLKSEAKPTQIWNFLRGNIVNYNNEEIIIKITHDQLTYFKNSGLESSMTKDTFRQTVARLRKNPPKRKP